VRERRARVLPLPFVGASSQGAIVAAGAGAALAATARALGLPLDGAAAAKAVLAATPSANDETEANARRAFDATRDALAASVG
jgi:hypothetical protein